MPTSTLEMAKRLHTNLKDFQERLKGAGWPKEDTLRSAHMMSALICDSQMIMDDLMATTGFCSDVSNQEGALVAYISGHLDLSLEEYMEHYHSKIAQAIDKGHSFVIGDARGTDTLAQHQLQHLTDRVTIYHMHDQPRFCMSKAFTTKGGFTSDSQRDAEMTSVSHYDIAWVKPDRQNSGTAKNIKRRLKTSDKAYPTVFAIPEFKLLVGKTFKFNGHCFRVNIDIDQCTPFGDVYCIKCAGCCTTPNHVILTGSEDLIRKVLPLL